MNQKRRSLVLIGFLLAIYLIGFVAAADSTTSPVADNAKAKIQTVIDVAVGLVTPIAEQVIGYDNEGKKSEYLFARVLFFVIILSIVYLSLNEISFFNNNTLIMWLVIVAVSILSTRYFVDDSWIQTILLPYATLGVALSAAFPFALYFMIVDIAGRNKSSFIRKTAWIFFCVIYVGLFLTRTDLQENSMWIYPITAGLAIIMAAMDGTINKFFAKADLNKMRNESMVFQVRALKRELIKLDHDMATGTVTKAEYLRESTALQDRINALHTGSGFFRP